MKKSLTILLMFVFLMGSIGLDVKAHYCGGELLQLSVNGLPINTSAGHEMPGCMDGDGCHSCKNVYKNYKVSAQFSMGQVVLIQPAMDLGDWFHGGMPSLALIHFTSWLPVGIDQEKTTFIYLARNHPTFTLPQGGLRAPPVA